MFSFPWWLSFSIGFLSLSEEILWVRVVGFRYETLPPAFSFVLVCYLVGIALGAGLGKRLCERSKDLYQAAAIVLGISALADVLTPWVIAHLMPSANLTAPALAIASTAALKSILFPIVHHLGSSRDAGNVGRSVSRIYFGNIVGASLGPLVTGFVALDHLSVDECFGVVAALCLVASMACALVSKRRSIIIVTLALAVVSSLLGGRIILPGPGSLAAFAAGGRDFMSNFIANRHGVIHTARTTQGDMVFGGNVYDGMATVDDDINPNNLQRLYVLALLHPNPKRVLFVGLSAGAWVRAMQGFTTVESIDVVEINPGYIQLARSYPQLAALLQDPRVHIHIDDGRRWLRRSAAARFDVIVQNTSYYWRANADNLLSREYLLEVKQHLSPGGVFTANTTGSFDVLATTQAVFAHAYRYTNFVYAADHSLVPDMGGLGTVMRPNGTPFVLDNPPPTSVAAHLVTARLEPAAAFIARRNADAKIITDDNLLTEYKDGRRFGPKLLRALLPAEIPHFEASDP